MPGFTSCSVQANGGVSFASSGDTITGATPYIVAYTITAGGTGAPTFSSAAWDFGDGNTSILQNPTHTYAAAGNYTATLTAIIDNSGAHTFNFTWTVNVTSTDFWTGFAGAYEVP